MYVGVDLGGTKTRIAAFPDRASPRFTEIARLETLPDYEAHLAQMIAAIRDVGQDVGQIEGVGMGVGVQMSKDGARIDVSYTMPSFEGKPIVADLSAALGIPVAAMNENILAVLAERKFGALGRFDRCAYLTVSTGTGAGIFLGDGSTSIAYLGQVGHHMIDPHGERCLCGQVGCVQTVTGGKQIHARYGKDAAGIEDESVWQNITEAIARGVVNLWRIVRLEGLAVGGGIGLNSPHIRAHLHDVVRELSPGIDLDISFATLGEDAPLIGAGTIPGPDLKTVILH